MFALGIAAIPAAFAFDDGNNGKGKNDYNANPFVFIGTAKDCGSAGSRIVTSAWLTGLGLPDNGQPNAPATTAANDPHMGLLLSKNGPYTDCSAAGATITGLNNQTTLTELGFDYRNGGHCGAGAPRFNITTTAGYTYFAGCADGTQTPAPQDTAQWTRVRFAPAQIFPQMTSNPPFTSTMAIKSISIIYDEGTDVPSAQDPNGVGLAVIDNIDINGTLITDGHGVGEDNKKSKKNGDD